MNRRKNQSYTYLSELIQSSTGAAINIAVAACLIAAVVTVAALLVLIWYFGTEGQTLAAYMVFSVCSGLVLFVAAFLTLIGTVTGQINSWAAPPTPRNDTRSVPVHTRQETTEVQVRDRWGGGS